MSRPSPLVIPIRLGASTLMLAHQIGELALLLARIVARLIRPRIDRHELIRNLHLMGVRSVPIVMATAAFTGAIMVVQAAPLLVRFNAREWVGWGATYTTFREVGPLLIALIFNGRVGANNAAELGTMVVTEQIDALRALAIDPINYLVLPRLISMVFTLFALTILGDAVALLGSMLTGYVLLDVSPRTFWNSVSTMIETWDLFSGLIKSTLFGGLIALTSCHFGLTVRGGAPGVGRGVNAAVVAAAAGIFIVDYLCTFILG
ncbi:MAG: ABC transporter permease [Myxococcota bacterium]